MLAGLLRTLLTVVTVWFVFRWLDRVFGMRRRHSAGQNGPKPSQGQSKSRQPDDNQVGEYVDYEEIDN
ncbi:MAG: hypothetical protein ACPGYK_04465 [Flavobacteriales bacterium]